MKQSELLVDFNILLADDDKDDCFFFKKALKELAFVSHLTIITDGAKLISYLSNKKDKLPDVIFLDINMPRKNGIECLTEIKQNDKLKHIPIIIYSTSIYDAVAASLYEKGAHYYLQKCDYSDLIDNISGILSLLKKYQQRPPKDKFVYKNFLHQDSNKWNQSGSAH